MGERERDRERKRSRKKRHFTNMNSQKTNKKEGICAENKKE